MGRDADSEREVQVGNGQDLEILPDYTTDEAPEWGDEREEDRELRLFEEKPPHHT